MSSQHRAHPDQQGQAILVAFVSADDAVDRAGAIANLSWFLASAGQSVLVIDLADAVHRVGDYLAPFMIAKGSPQDVGGLRPAREFMATFDRTPAETLTVTRFAVPAANGEIDVLPMAATGRAPRKGQDPGPDRLRAYLVQTPYDYIVINAPSLREQSEGGARTGYDLVARMCDVAVLCFSHRRAAVEAAVSAGESLHRLAPGGIQLVPLAFTHGGVQLTTGSRRAEPEAVFTELLSANPRPDTVVLSVPEVVANTPVLAVLTEPPAGPRPIVDAYARLADAVSFGEIRSIGAVPDVYFARYRRSVGLADAGEPDHFLVVYAPADRPWADWVVAELRATGALVSTPRQAGATTEPVELVVIGTPAFAGAVRERFAADLDRPVSRRTQIVVEPTEPLAGMSVLDLVGVEPESAAGRLHAHFGLVRTPGEPGQPATVRHPARRPAVVRLPPRHPAFTGRTEALEALRDRLLYGDGAAVTLVGAPGVGKAELAHEYAYRFMNDYDVVWWIPAHDGESVLANILSLCRRLRETSTADVPGPLRLLGSEHVTGRWLLIFAHADRVDQYEHLLPPAGRGHVVVTSSGDAGLAVPPLGPDESRTFLTRLLPQVGDPDKIARIAAAVGHVPLALELATAWLTDLERGRTVVPGTARQTAKEPVDELVDRLGTTGDAGEVAHVLDLMSAHLRETEVGRLTLLLAQFCAFLSPQGASLGLLRSTAVIDRLVAVGGPDAARLAADPVEIDQLLAHGHRLRLFHVDWGPPRKVTLATVVREVLQNSLPNGFRTKLQEQVLLALARYAPSELDSDEPTSVRRFTELGRHIMSTGAQESAHPAVRRWLVDQTRHLYRTNDPDLWEAMLEPVRQLHEKWRAEHTEKDPFVCLLGSHLAKIYRGLGKFDIAFALNSQVLDNQRVLLSRTHFRALLTAGGVGADLRALARFDDALDEDIATLAGLREAFGDDHPLTLAAQNNLVVSYFHAGDVTRALALGREDHAHRVRLFGDDHPEMWQTLANLGVYERAAGLTADSVRTLRRARDLAVSRHSPTSTPVALVKWLLSISTRLDPAEDTTMAKSLNGEALRDLRDLHGDAHPTTLACKLSYATAHRAIGEPQSATVLAAEALAGFLALPGMQDRHPYPASCQVELGLALSAAGQVEEAVEPAAAGWLALTECLGPAHPSTLAAQIDHAAVLAAAGRAVEARTAADEAAQACVDYLTMHHHYQRISQANQLAAQDPGATWQTVDVSISMP